MKKRRIGKWTAALGLMMGQLFYGMPALATEVIISNERMRIVNYEVHNPCSGEGADGEKVVLDVMLHRIEQIKVDNNNIQTSSVTTSVHGVGVGLESGIRYIINETEQIDIIVTGPPSGITELKLRLISPGPDGNATVWRTTILTADGDLNVTIRFDCQQ